MSDANKLAESLRTMRSSARRHHDGAGGKVRWSVVLDESWRGDLSDAADMLDQMRAEIGRLEHPAAQADQVNVKRVTEALSWMGYSTPEGGTEAAAAHLGRLVNDLATAVLKHKQETQDRQGAEVVSVELLFPPGDGVTYWRADVEFHPLDELVLVPNAETRYGGANGGRA